MELKLQQAIVAARAGRNDLAQHLLTEVLQENPDQANAWFLLSHLVESEARQKRYLRKALQINPQHDMAQTRLTVLEQEEALPEDIQAAAAREQSIEVPPIPPLDSGPAAGPADYGVAEESDTIPPPRLPQWLDNVQNRELTTATPNRQQVDDAWRQTAGAPKRDPRGTATAVPATSRPQPAHVSASATTDTWLMRGLYVLVAVAFVLLAYLVYLLLI